MQACLNAANKRYVYSATAGAPTILETLPVTHGMDVSSISAQQLFYQWRCAVSLILRNAYS